MKLLRNPDFQDLLVNYQRAKRTFWVGYEVKDEVTSRKLFGKWEKPEDYLEAFTKFVRGNADQVGALRILLKRPHNWNPEALSELRHTLRMNDFDDRKRLRDAHKKVYRKDLADVISMVKHAADQQEPLLTAEERVAKMSDIVQKLWGFCHTLRHDGIDYGDYIEQLTYLLFLKMADERGAKVPKGLRLGIAQAQVRHATDRSLRRHPAQTPRSRRAARRHLRAGHAAL